MLSEITKQYLIVDFSNLMTLSQTDIYFKYKEIGTTNVQSKLVHGRKSIDLTDCRVVLNIINASGDMIVDVPNIIDAKNGIIEINFSTASLSKGISFFELTIIESNSATKKSPRISYRVLDSLVEDAVIESDRYPILINLINEVEDLHDTSENLIKETNTLKDKVIELNEMVTNAEEVRESNEDTRISNEASRCNFEIIRESNERVRQDTLRSMNSLKDELVSLKSQTEIVKSETDKVRQDTIEVKDSTIIVMDKTELVRSNTESVRISTEIVKSQAEDKIVDCENRMDFIENEFDKKIVEVNSSKEDMELALSGKILDVDNKLESVDERVGQAIASGTIDLEVKDSRTGLDGTLYECLNDRLNAIENNPYILFETVEG